MPITRCQPIRAPLTDCGWRGHARPGVVVGAPEPGEVDWSETELFVDGPHGQDWARVHTATGDWQRWDPPKATPSAVACAPCCR